MELGSSNYRLVEKYEIRTNFFLFRFSLKLFGSKIIIIKVKIKNIRNIKRQNITNYGL